jgi:hypothetical protein
MAGPAERVNDCPLRRKFPTGGRTGQGTTLTARRCPGGAPTPSRDDFGPIGPPWAVTADSVSMLVRVIRSGQPAIDEVSPAFGGCSPGAGTIEKERKADIRPGRRQSGRRLAGKAQGQGHRRKLNTGMPVSQTQKRRRSQSAGCRCPTRRLGDKCRAALSQR